MVLGLTSLTNPVKLTKYMTVKFYGDVNEWSNTHTECSILGIELIGNLVIGGFFWSTKISKPAIIIGYHLGFRFSTKDEIKTAKKNKGEIIEIWNLLIDKYSDVENIWDFLENLKEGEDFESLKSIIRSEPESNWDELDFTHIQIVPEGKFDEVNEIVLQKKMDIPNLEILKVYKSSPRLINLLLPASLESVLRDLNSNEPEILNGHIMMKIAFGVIEDTIVPEVDLEIPGEIYNNIIKKYNPDIVSKILKTTPWLGMTKEMIVDTFGPSFDENEKVTKNKVKCSLFYPGSGWKWRKFPTKNRLGNDEYTFRIDLENDIVVGWENSDDV